MQAGKACRQGRQARQAGNAGRQGRQAGRQERQADEILSYGDFLKIQYPDACKCFLVFNAVIDAEWSKTIS